ncbi:histidine-rich glycoprotein-like [Ctenocephalides felis]|uniref:histidine-rich glycoprotein-like n=1 Tax=Ctenocephalides felis TaxID=7515 RepID=UPI000E6E34D4|nr:histidine-rich glycoprotein-like [Ctenocephalides felis]
MRALTFILFSCLLFAAFVRCDDEAAETDHHPVGPESCTKENEEFQPCGTSCPVTCANHLDKTPKPCTLQCVIGCHCKAGFVKNDEGNCVKEEDCPNHPSGDHEHHEGDDHEHHEEKHEDHENHDEKHENHENHDENHEHHENHDENHEHHD